MSFPLKYGFHRRYNKYQKIYSGYQHDIDNGQRVRRHEFGQVEHYIQHVGGEVSQKKRGCENQCRRAEIVLTDSNENTYERRNAKHTKQSQKYMQIVECGEGYGGRNALRRGFCFWRILARQRVLVDYSVGVVCEDCVLEIVGRKLYADGLIYVFDVLV